MKLADYRRVIDPIVQPQTFKPRRGIGVHVVAHVTFPAQEASEPALAGPGMIRS